MRTSPAADIAPQTLATRIITAKLEQFLLRDRVRRVYFAEDSAPPPVLAYVTHFPRLYLPLAGSHVVDVAQNAVSTTIRTVRGQALFVPENAWDKPEWSGPIEVLTFLFGAKHFGISLAQHKGRSEAPVNAIKTHIHGAYDGLTHSILAALTAFAADRSQGPLDRLLIEALLHSCLRLFRAPSLERPRKAIRTYESICLYMQENFQVALTRESVAEHFGLAPNHVSRLFRREGQIRFNDYLNSIRMNRAKFMLRNYSLTLKEIAANCGYNDIAYFCRMFKKMNNETPTQYRGVDSGVGALTRNADSAIRSSVRS
ncbi:MAG: AraC family transcriptional regulator [Acidobacteria bacterium]|nr:MAG: AraC family transcriptional regulator [Acidobacteriota bacterium]